MEAYSTVCGYGTGEIVEKNETEIYINGGDGK